MQNAALFDLPGDLSEPGVVSEPGGYTQLTVRIAGTTHTVVLTDFFHETPEIARFLQLARAIEDLFGRRPEVKRLPYYAHLCM